MGATIQKYLIAGLMLQTVSLQAQSIFNTAWVSPPTEWEVRNPRVIGYELCSIAFGNGVFVAVDKTGAMLTSSDGMSWTNTPIAAWLRDITFGEGMYVAVGGPPNGSGCVFTSRNAINWVKRSFSGAPLKTVAYGDGTFVAAGDHSIHMSAEGLRWRTVRSGMGATINDLAYGKGKFVVVGTNRLATLVFRSRNGIDWNKQSYPDLAPWRTLSFAGGAFYAMHPSTDVFTSADGISWTNAPWPFQQPYTQLASGNGYVRGVPADHFYDTPHTRVDSVAYGNGRFVAVGRGGAVAMALALAPTNYNSRWLNMSGASDHNLIDVEYGNGTYLAISSSGMVMGSIHAVDWSRYWPSVGGNLSGFGLTGVAFGNGVFVAVTHTLQYIASSPDGKTWTRRGNRTVGSDGFMDVAFGNGMFMAVGHTTTRQYGIIRTSGDAQTWGFVGGDIHLYGPFVRVDFDGAYFVVTRKNGMLLYTADGQTWSHGRPSEDWEWPTRAFNTTHGRVNAWVEGPNGTVAVGDGCLILHAPK